MASAEHSGIRQRMSAGESDFWLVREFLQRTWAKVPPGVVWDIRRWDGSYFHRASPGWGEGWGNPPAIGIWKTADHGIVAVAHPESGGDAWLELDPEFSELMPAMLDWSEQHINKLTDDGVRKAFVFASDHDTRRLELLNQQGYQQTKTGEVLRCRSLDDVSADEVELPGGYRVYEMRPGHPEDCERYAALINAAFKRNFHCREEIATFTTNSPSFRPDLELIAVDPEGKFTALAGMIYDEVNRFGLFEPVCADPGPRPLGLTGKLMLEGLRRVKLLGAENCYVGTGKGMAANRFYDALGFEIIHSGWFWGRELPAS